MDQVSDIQQWYSIGCLSSLKELKVRDDARNYGLEAFVPLKYQIRTSLKQKQRILVPAISGLLFVKGTEEEVKAYVDRSHFQLYMRKSTFSNKEDYLTVPCKAMEAFIAVTENNEQHITYYRPDEIKLQAGDQIRVKGGIYDGKEGIIMRIKGKRNKQLVVQIPGLLVAAVEMAPELIELKAQQQEIIDEKPSKNIDTDKKFLYDTAHRLLFDITGPYKESAEYFLLLSELKRCRARLLPIKGFTPATEAELALPLYMAAVIINEDIEPCQKRLIKAMARLKDCSKLKARCEEMLRTLNFEL
ncbi:UpxY family transcription antiterminator [Prevotella sp. P6B4]|uniref:UpxY family transcription antiterminator n=1 Tax=Prevotella sp. P6B4 TaxID=1410614 RepID=UPI0004920E35|nr:UpxY family transcription antiterminator [Prevotella sp. P6B4]